MVREYRHTFLERRNRFLKTKYKSNLRQILSYQWEYKKLFFIVLFLGFVQSILFFSFPLFLAPALDILVNPSKSIEMAVPIFVIIFSIQGFVGLLFGIRIYVNRWMGANIIYNLRNDLFSTLQIMSFSWYDDSKTGELLSRTTSDVNLLKEFLGSNFQ